MLPMTHVGNLAPSMRKDPYFSSVVLLLHLNGADGSTTISDVKGHTMTAVGNGQLDTAQWRFAPSSLLLDGSGDRVTTPDAADWDLGSGDFTIEAWFRPNAIGDASIIAQWPSGGGANRAWGIWLRSSGAVQGEVVVNGSTEVNLLSSSSLVTTGKWYFVSFTRSGSSFYLHLDGVAIVSTTGSGTVNNSTSSLVVGDQATNDWPFNGWIDELRVTKGVGRHGSANYVPPTAPFPDF